MSRLLVTLLLVGAAVLVFGVTARADTVYGYAGPGEWFSVGEGHGSNYDYPCGHWVDNNFAKAGNAWGLVTFIDTSGGWNYTQQGYGNIFRQLPNHQWKKKLHCKNNSGSAYQGGCFGFMRSYQCA
jgi:hypothetical protein